jgi:hypothetical protein
VGLNYAYVVGHRRESVAERILVEKYFFDVAVVFQRVHIAKGLDLEVKKEWDHYLFEQDKLTVLL